MISSINLANVCRIDYITEKCIFLSKKIQQVNTRQSLFRTTYTIQQWERARDGTRLHFLPLPREKIRELPPSSWRQATVHRTVVFNCSSPTRVPKKRPPVRAASFLVREMGLEPTRHNHTHLKRACLPFQHSRKCLNIITVPHSFVNNIFPASCNFRLSLIKYLHILHKDR